MIVPPEIIYHIIPFLSPQEIIRLEVVSKQFYAIVNDPTVWRMMYQNAPFPLPPGPFTWQSTRFLKRTLIHSARLARTWTSQTLKVISSRKVHERVDHGSCWVDERWLVVKRGTRLIAHDIDTDSHQILWESASITCWTTCSIICAQGHLVFLVLRECDGDHPDVVTLLEFRANDDSGHLSGPVAFNVPITFLEGRKSISAKTTHGPFVKISVDQFESDQSRLVIFDIRSRGFYKLPRFTSEMNPLYCRSPPEPESFSVVLTTTHIVVASHLISDILGENEQIIQAFIIPDGPARPNNEISQLSLSHEMILHGTGYDSLSLLRDSVVNEADGSTTLIFLHFYRWCVSWCCTTLFMPRSHPTLVVQMSLEMQPVLEFDTLLKCYHSVTTEHGFIRGFYTGAGSRSGEFSKFAIDASEEGKIVTTIHDAGDRGSFPFESVFHWFDGVRGRICYTTHSDATNFDDSDETNEDTDIDTFVLTVE